MKEMEKFVITSQNDQNIMKMKCFGHNRRKGGGMTITTVEENKQA